MKHSPAPWKVKLNHDNMINEQVKGRHTIKDADDWNIARVWELPEAEANARLIAAAPDLLDALKEIYQLLGDYTAWLPELITEDQKELIACIKKNYKIARLAISKADGIK